MRRMFALAFLVSFLVASVTLVSAKESKIIDEHNKYGGKTEEENYSKGDEAYEEGLSRIIEYYDGSNRIRRIESFYTDEHSRKDGVFKREQYYENEPFEKAEIEKAEFYYTDKFAAENGIYKAEHYYKDAKKEKTEFYFTDAHAKKKLVSRLEVYYSSKGDVIRRVYYDKNGDILSSDGGGK